MGSTVSIIGFAGHIGAGKTLAAGMVPGATHLQWSDAVYRGVAAVLGIEEAALRDRTTKDATIAVAGLDLSPRRLLQTLGTEWGRELIHPDLWVSLTMERIRQEHEQHGTARFVICGTRFPNEVAAIRKHGGEVWWIDRPGCGPGQHVSDRVISQRHCDRVIPNDREASDLRRCVRAAWECYQHRRLEPVT